MSTADIAVSVISANNFQVESYIPEINISFIKVGDPADTTLDAYGSEVIFPAKVVTIDPAETIKDGVSTYRVVLEFNANDDRIKSGMTGNTVITTAKKQNVISVPQGMVTIKDGKKTVSVKKGDSIVEVTVETGSVSSSGNIEILSGLADGDVVIIK
jgi:HlyD family secretion protein